MMPSDLPSRTPDADAAITEQQVCPGCVTLNDPDAHFCIKCGAPLSSYAATAPFESLFAQGHVYRQASEQPRNWIMVAGIWLIFGGLALVGLSLIVWGRESQSPVMTVGGALAFTAAAVLIFKTTRNYLARKSNHRSRSPEH